MFLKKSSMIENKIVLFYSEILMLDFMINNMIIC